MADERYENEPGDPKAIWAHKMMSDSKTAVEKWRKSAKEADKFQAGAHFSKTDLELLQREQRPTAAFNVAQKFIRFVSGLERRSRQEICFLPREIMNDSQQQVGGLATKVFEYVLQNCQGDDERSRAFEDCLVRGMGWTDVFLERNLNPDGEIILSRVDGHEMGWDSHATKDNLADANYLWRDREIPKAIAKKRWPGKDWVFDANAGMPGDLAGGRNESILISEKEAVPVETSSWPAVKRGNVKITEFQWAEEVPGAYFIDPFTKKEEWMDEDAFREYHRRYARVFKEDIDHDRLLVKRFQRMTMCSRTILSGPTILPGKRFTFNCITGQWDADEGLWYGYMRLLMDPQKYLTKFVNQVMEIITKQAKGGLLAESDAFQNLQQAEQQYAKTGSITWMNPGAISGKKIQEKSLPEIPPASIEMFKVCTDMLKEVTGVAPEISMGTGAADEPALTMRQRQLASIALLAKEFASLSRYRIEEAKTIYDFFQYIADERVIRIGGPYDSQAIQLFRDPLMMEYDVVLDESTRDPNVREQYLQTIMQIAPTLIRTNNFIPELLDFFPLPASLRHAIKEGMAKQAQMQQQMRAMGLDPTGRGKRVDPKETAAKIQKLQSDALMNQTKSAVMIEQVKQSKMKTVLENIIKAAEIDLQGSQAMGTGPTIPPSPQGPPPGAMP